MIFSRQYLPKMKIALVIAWFVVISAAILAIVIAFTPGEYLSIAIAMLASFVVAAVPTGLLVYAVMEGRAGQIQLITPWQVTLWPDGQDMVVGVQRRLSDGTTQRLEVGRYSAAARRFKQNIDHLCKSARDRAGALNELMDS